MFKSFDTIKAQLTELAPAINAFKSEAVQLRIVELIFSRRSDAEDEHGDAPPGRKKNTRPKKAKTANGAQSAAPAVKAPKRKGGASGPVLTLTELSEGDFFTKHRTLGAIIEHCKNNKAKTFRPDQLSGPLARFVRDGRLKRQKNGDGQYEYWK